MRRIISRKAKESIRKYILENITLADYGVDESLMTDSEKLLRTYSIFKDEKQWESIHFGDPPAFRHWLRGTPRAMAIATSYYDQRKIIGSWLEEALEEIEQYDDYCVADLYYWLITREFLQMVRRIQKDQGSDVEMGAIN